MRTIKRFILPMLVLIAVCMPWSVYASSAYSLTVSFMKDDHELPIDGAEISVYQVADATLYDTWASYRLRDTYSRFRKIDDKGNDITFDGITASESNELAKSLVSVKDTPVVSGVTDKAGSLTANGLTEGMYLIVQTGKTDTASGYEMFEPFLVSVPMYEDRWIPDVKVEPKTGVMPVNTETQTPTKEIRRRTKTGRSTPSTDSNPTDSVSSDKETPTSKTEKTASIQTGDSTNFWYWVRMMALSGSTIVMMLLIATIIRRKEKDHA